MKEIEHWNYFPHNNFIWKYKFVGFFYFWFVCLEALPFIQGFIVC